MIKIEKEEQKLRQKQQAALNSLLKRIQRDRDEQLRHRAQDSQKLVQRNRNVLQDIIQKQQLEAKKTLDFLKYSLGKRSPNRPGGTCQSNLGSQMFGEASSYNSRLPLIKQVMNYQSQKERSNSNQNSNSFLTPAVNKESNLSVEKNLALTQNYEGFEDIEERRNR